MRSMLKPPLSSLPLRAAALLIAGTTVACVQTSRNAEAAVLRCDDLGGLIAAYQTVHYSVRRITPELQRRAVEQFVEALDPSRTLLLESEVDAMKQRLYESFDDFRKGECGPLEEAYALVRRRAAEDTALARALIADKKFAIDRDVKLVIDPEERGYPKTQEARRALGRALVHFQMANYVSGGVSLDKAKKQLVHRYELTEKRLGEQQEEKRIPEMFAEAFARALDPHTAYMSYDSLADFKIHMKLSLEGIGAALRTEDGFTYIESLIPGGGAERSGKLRPKDKIIAVAQEGEEPVSTIDMSIRDVVKLIRGKKGTTVTLTILREGSETRTFDVTIIRDKIDVQQQAAKLELEERKVGDSMIKVGVLELPSFYGSGRDDDGRSSYEDVKRLIGEAKSAGAQALVLDLSKNGGGYLEDAVRISGLFLREGAIVATKDTDGEVTVLRDDDEATAWSGPLVVLVSPMSASASEILAGSLQAYGRAVVVGAGKSSFGKGSVQTLRPLPGNLGAMKVTTGMYFLPSGRSTQQTGVEVDLTVPSLLSTIDMGEKDLDYSLPPQSTGAFLSSGINGEGSDRWRPVSPITIARLAERSRDRVAKKETFREIEEELEKAKKKKGSIALSEILDKNSDTRSKGGDPKKAGEATTSNDEEERRFERMDEVFEDEATDIAVDLVLEARSRASLGARSPGEAARIR